MGLITFADESGLMREVSVNDPLPVTEWVGGRKATKTIAFTGAAGLGAVGTISLFTVTGSATFRIVAYCTENLASAGGGTLALGTAGNPTGFNPTTTATDIDNGDLWFDGTPINGITETASFVPFVVVNGSDLILTVGTADITDGTMVFDIYWSPFSSDSSVVAA